MNEWRKISPDKILNDKTKQFCYPKGDYMKENKESYVQCCDCFNKAFTECPVCHGFYCSKCTDIYDWECPYCTPILTEIK